MVEDYQIVVLSADHFNAIIFEGPKRENQIYLYLYNNQYDIITSVSSFLGRNYWYLDCKKRYDKQEEQRCKKVCKCCFTEGCQGVAEKAPWRECGTCQRMFEMCWNCEEFVDPNTHRCYMKPIVIEENEDQEQQEQQKKKKKSRRKRRRVSEEMISHEVEEEDRQDEEGQEYLFVDIESRQDDGQHIANLLIVQDEEGFEMVFRGDDCVNQFGTWLLDGTHQGAIVIAHNLRGYDGILLCEYFYKQCLLPNLILNGAKIMSMELTEAEIKFRDSLNFLPMSLKALPKTFGLTQLKKGYFPHFFKVAQSSFLTFLILIL